MLGLLFDPDPAVDRGDRELSDSGDVAKLIDAEELTIGRAVIALVFQSIAALEVVGVEPTAPVDGVSFAPTLTDAGAPDRHTVQYYEMFGCRALYQDGWKAVVYHPIQSDDPGLDVAEWELYDVAGDPSLRRQGKREERKGEKKEELDRAQEQADDKADEVADLERKT